MTLDAITTLSKAAAATWLEPVEGIVDRIGEILPSKHRPNIFQLSRNIRRFPRRNRIFFNRGSWLIRIATRHPVFPGRRGGVLSAEFILALGHPRRNPKRERVLVVVRVVLASACRAVLLSPNQNRSKCAHAHDRNGHR